MTWPLIFLEQQGPESQAWNLSVKIVHICEKHFTRFPCFITKHMVFFKHAATAQKTTERRQTRRINNDLAKSSGLVRANKTESLHYLSVRACFQTNSKEITSMLQAVCISCTTVKFAGASIEHSVDNITRLWSGFVLNHLQLIQWAYLQMRSGTLWKDLPVSSPDQYSIPS